MDDLLEQPTTLSIPDSGAERADDANLSSGDEDEGLDWTKLPSSSRPVIPKRGDKDFEPTVHGGSGLQRHVLDRARNAMFEALRAERNTSSKSISHGIWYPNLARTHVTTARGIHFTSMGHSFARASPVSPNGPQQKAVKRLELLPEEAIYLVERGSMFCWKAMDGVDFDDAAGLEDMEGAPMTVQQVFTEMVGTEDLTLEKYHVFSYLKRLGYVVMRTKPPSSAYLTAEPYSPPLGPRSSLVSRLCSSFIALLHRVFGIFKRTSNSWLPSIFHNGFTYPGVFASLRFLPSGHKTPLHIVQLKPEEQSPSPYELFYNVYKPATPFKKTAPPKPDFQITVVNARTTPIPTISELTELFDVLPELPPPVPRRRIPYADQKRQAQEREKAKSASAPGSQPTAPSTAAPSASASASAPASTPSTSANPTLFRRLFSWAWTAPESKPQERKPNPFAVLKQGKKMVVIAAVDSGMISFFSFRQGGFEEFPMA
ncbi:tRNA-splicing endonuclease subunit sen54 [Steccherinum ochraceum]|uniref:tRNA-splicing endonuclease subunit sen54 n=1 Tax=Steccherinum ochraceum TaxID=92696 RepID=A0A4R0R7V7_9APHY|nr:tRNA-splicing endonuclease subunit sen54 [Steccherinum ochraceum]